MCVCAGQVSDVENILGVVHTENINIVAEAYDVALEITFPKGSCSSSSISTNFRLFYPSINNHLFAIYPNKYVRYRQ